ncbi:MAG: Ig-like domain-containing protein, partial [Planctomycetes bacterium]|nr:Ig-like domain-containing protein [Planctomycetota bacterium]
PFLELGEELWNGAGTRFTLFFDPGRIKRGLKPREEMGPVLEEGKPYTLIVSADWPDADGQPLAEDYQKSFHAVAPDDEQPDPKKWRVVAPAAGSRTPLEVRFAEPLDHAMLLRVLNVFNSAGGAVEGEIEVADYETRWRFIPAKPWVRGDYRLVVDTALEDSAGNSIRKPFEVDITRPFEKNVKPDTVSLPFSVQ